MAEAEMGGGIEVSNIISAMVTYGSNDSLFVIDNAHLALARVAEIVNDWRNKGKQSRLLVLMREVKMPPSLVIGQIDVGTWGLASCDLANDRLALEGVYRRLFRQANGAEPTSISNACLEQWEAIFKGDLMVFSFAVSNRVGQAGFRPDTLGPQDAIAAVDERYLKKYPGERDNLVALACVQKFEFQLAEGCLKEAALSSAIKAGDVWLARRPTRTKYNYFRFVHAGIADLILKAANVAESDQALIRRRTLLKEHPTRGYRCFNFAVILQRNGMGDEARELINALWDLPGWPLTGVRGSQWRLCFRTTQKLLNSGSPDFDARIGQWFDGLSSHELERILDPVFPLDGIVDLLRLCEVEMPKWYSWLCDALNAPSNRDWLYESWRISTPGNLKNFSDHVKTNGPFTPLIALMSYPPLDPDHSKFLQDWLADIGPENLLQFMEYWKEFEPIFADINFARCTERWEYSRWPSVYRFKPFFDLCIRNNRPDLAGLGALVALRSSQVVDWSDQSATALVLSHIVAAAPRGCDGDVLAFLGRCISNKWLDKQIESGLTPLGVLAFASRQFALNENPEIRATLRRPTLTGRLSQNRPSASSPADHVSAWLQLVGWSGMLFGRNCVPMVATLTPTNINAALGYHKPTDEGGVIQPFQRGLWVGLHEWLHAHSSTYRCDSGLASGILADFRAAEAEPGGRSARLNEMMIAWLEECETNDWRLVTPQSSIAESMC